MRRETDLEATLVAKYVVMGPLLNERTRRLWAAAESIAIGFEAMRSSRRPRGWPARTIRNGREELAQGVTTDRMRQPGAGRPGIEDTQPGDHRGAGPAGRTADARRTDVAPAVDVQEHRETGRRADRARVAGERDDGREASPWTNSVIASTRCRRPAKARRTLIATRSSNTSTRRRQRLSDAANR